MFTHILVTHQATTKLYNYLLATFFNLYTMTLPNLLKRNKSIVVASSKSKNNTNESPQSSSSQMQQIVDLSEKNFCDMFHTVRTLCSGNFSEILLVRDRTTKERLVLKAITNEHDFLTESALNYFLSPHPNIVTSYNVAFSRNDHFLYPLEYGAYGNLSRYIFGSDTTRKTSMLKENQVKVITKQLSSALEFMHSLNLVHREVVAENVLVFKPDLSTVKLSDFGRTEREDSLVTKQPMDHLSSSEYQCPEIASLVLQENYYCHRSSDVWQFGILLIICLTGEFPWEEADPLTDFRYADYCDWLKRKNLRQPDCFNAFTPRLIRLLKRLLEPKWKNRSEIKEVNKYLEDDWIRKGALTPSGAILTMSRSNSRHSSRRSSRNSYAGTSGGGSTNIVTDTHSHHHKIVERKISSNSCGTTAGTMTIVHNRSSSCRIKRKRSSAGSSRRLPKKTPVVHRSSCEEESNNPANTSSSQSCSVPVPDAGSNISSNSSSSSTGSKVELEEKVGQWILNSHVAP